MVLHCKSGVVDVQIIIIVISRILIIIIIIIIFIIIIINIVFFPEAISAQKILQLQFLVKQCQD